IAHLSADAVIRHPLHMRGIHATLKDEVLKQSPDFIVRKRREHSRTQAKAAPQATRHIVLATTFPSRELPRRAHPRLARIQAQQDFTKGEEVKGSHEGYQESRKKFSMGPHHRPESTSGQRPARRLYFASSK